MVTLEPNPRPTPNDVRRAADALKDAIDRHLFAVETRMGEQDPTVQRAFQDITDTAEHYDDLLYRAYDEVTPFDFGDDVEGELDDAPLESDSALDAPPVISVLLRRDYAILDPMLLVETGRDAFRAMREAGMPMYEDTEPQNLPGALYAMFQVAGADGFDNGSEEAGLTPLGGAVWFMAAERAALVDVNTPFEDIDPGNLIFRIQEVPEIES